MQIMVDTSTLDNFTRYSSIFPDVMKIDVEGAEVKVLQGAHNLLEDGRTRMIISTHNESLKSECTRLLRSYQYEVLELPGFSHEIICFPRIS